jgi:hypothetical protein
MEEAFGDLKPPSRRKHLEAICSVETLPATRRVVGSVRSVSSMKSLRSACCGKASTLEIDDSRVLLIRALGAQRLTEKKPN